MYFLRRSGLTIFRAFWAFVLEFPRKTDNANFCKFGGFGDGVPKLAVKILFVRLNPRDPHDHAILSGNFEQHSLLDSLFCNQAMSGLGLQLPVLSRQVELWNALALFNAFYKPNVL